MKQEKQIVGLYMRLSQEDERSGESLSIENQRHMLRKYCEEHGFEIYGEYIDDGVSGTTFNRPEVQRLLDDAKTGVINTILVKDLSRFGRNYIEVGQYLDYVFPAFGIRFIAIQDNVDTENRDSGGMEMMPIMNVFNEWHAANTSKKIRAVRLANAKEGIYSAKKATYGYIKGTDKKRTPIIDEETAPVVRRIFEMYASGVSPKQIADILNAEGVPSPGKHAFEKYGHKGRPTEMRLWCEISIRAMLDNIIYIGHLPMLQETSVSYKNHKRYKKDVSDWVITYNNHEPIISQELWDKVHERKKSVAQGRKTKTGFVHPLSGFLICADCGCKLKMSGTWNKSKSEYRYHFDCGYHLRYGKTLCSSHFIQAKVLEQIVLGDIQDKARRITLDEQSVREEFIRHNAELTDSTIKTARKELKAKQRRLEELSRLMQVAYEDRVKGKMPEDLCISFLEKYSAEQKALIAEITELEQKISQVESTTQNVDDFIRNIKKYLEVPELTREMCYELIDRIIVGGLPKITGKERTIEIIYKVDMASIFGHRVNRP
ncbi:MAG: recombinase family protein [Muribaculaceae bacterium]|nr:recombinase family protein [Muribaculaceae bacterium]MCM1440518.1 recombinase family protein [Roseburia sp.]